MRKSVFLIVILTTILAANVAIAAPLSQDADGEVYIVQAGDWLSKIAGRFYGDILAYPIIVEATNAKATEDGSFAVIDDPDVIEVGQKLWIPTQNRLTLEALRNAKYQGIYDEPVQLTNGKYEGEPFVPGGASRPTVIFVEDANAFGDLNGDGIHDTAVILAENSGGSGVFMYLAAVINQDGAPVNVATQFIGDRVQINSMSIGNGEITINATTHGPDDPFCCPTVETVLTYRWQDEQLVEVSPDK